MELTEKQKNHIREKYDELKNDEQTLGELLDIIVDNCLDEYVIDLSDDEDGDIYEEFSNEVWDFLENLNMGK